MEKMAIFIDGGYLAKVMREKYGNARIDFEHLLFEISDGHELFRTYYYYCPVHVSNPPTEEERDRQRKQSAFFQALCQLPRFDIKYGRLVKRDNSGKVEFEQKRVDVLLAVDIVRLAWQNRIDKAVIIAGDDDFVPAIIDVKNAGIITILYYSRQSYSRELFNTCDERRTLDDILAKSIRK